MKKIKVDFTNPLINSFSYTLDKKRITFFFNITEKNFDSIYYTDYSEKNPARRILCNKLEKNYLCTKTKIFNIGNHNIKFEVLDKAGNSAEKSINLAV